MNRLQERRLELGLTQPQVSERLKEADPRMDVGMVSRFERGACLPTEPVLLAYEAALQAPRTRLYGEDELSAIESIAGSGAPDKPPEGVLRLVNKLGHGRVNAVTRSALSRRMGLSDRKVRELIEQARRVGYIIINAQDGRGYYLSDDLDEMAREYRCERKRALSVLSRLKTMRAILKEDGRAV